MKMEYGYKYKYESVLETVLGYDKLFDEALVNQTFTYTNAWEDMNIYKDFLALVKADKETINNQNPSSLVKSSKGLGESLPLISLNGGKCDFGNSPIVIFRKLTDDFIFHSYNQIIRLFGTYSDKDKDMFVSYPKINNLMEFVDENDRNFNQQKNISILETAEYRFDFLKNLYSNEELKSFKYINNLHISAESSFFNNQKSSYLGDDARFFNKAYNFKESDNLVPFVIPQNFSTLEDVGPILKIPTSIKKIDYISVYKLPKEILDKLELTWVSIPKNIPIPEFIGLTKHFNISTLINVPIKAPDKNISPSDILGMTTTIASFSIANDGCVIYKALTKDIFYLDAYGFDKKTKNTTIASFGTLTKGDMSVFFTDNSVVDKAGINVFTFKTQDVSKPGVDVLFNSNIIVGRYGNNISFNKNNTVENNAKGINIIKILNLDNSNKTMDIYGDVYPIDKSDTKDMYALNYERIYMTKNSKSMNYQSSIVSMYKQRIRDVDTKDTTTWLGEELKYRPIHILETNNLLYKDNTYKMWTNDQLVIDVSNRDLSANTFVRINRIASYGSVLKADQVVLSPSRKAIHDMYEELVEIHREVPLVDIQRVINLASRTDALLLLQDKAILINKLSKGIATDEDFLTVIKSDKSVLLSMLGLWTNKISKDFGSNDEMTFATKSNKSMDANDIELKVTKNSKGLREEENPRIIGKVVKQLKDVGVDSTFFAGSREPKDLGETMENINIGPSIINIDSNEFKMEAFSNSIHQIMDANQSLLKYLSSITDVKTIEDTFSNLSNRINMESDKEGIEWFVPIKQFGTNQTQEIGASIIKALSTMPFLEELVNDPIGRDVVMFEMPEKCTVDDEFIHFKTQGLDELLLPSEDFDYSVFKDSIFDYATGLPIDPVKKINDTTFIAKYPVDHAIGFGGEIGRKYVNVNVYNLKFLLEIFYVTWQRRIFEFGVMDLRSGIQKMMKYMAMYIEYRIPPNIQEESWRCYELIRWYAEATIMYNSTYQITFKYKSWESALYTGIISCPHTLTDVIINSGYVLENTANHAEIELQQEVKKEGFIQFDARILDGRMDVYINTIKVTSFTTGQRVTLPIIKGTLDVKIVFDGEYMRVGNIVIDNCEFDDIVTEYHMEVGKANLGLDLITKRICSFFEVTNENFDTMKEGIQGSLSLRDLSNRLVGYFDDHHKNKTKGKRLTIKKGML